MTQRTINLYDGLEALYYLDSSYYDGTADEIKDKSGHGRHAEASGGPTVGVEGPASFEATSFDGSDDQFDLDSISAAGGPFTVTFTAKLKKIDQAVIGSTRTSNGIIRVDTYNNLGYYEGNDGYTVRVDDVVEYDKWQTLTVMSSGNSDLGFFGDDGTAVAWEDIDDTFSMDIERIAPDGVGNIEKFNGEISFVGVWNRTLSLPELKFLTNMTAPVRSQL